MAAAVALASAHAVPVIPFGVGSSLEGHLLAVQGGTVEMTILNSGILATQAKEFAVYDFPFLFANPRAARASNQPSRLP